MFLFPRSAKDRMAMFENKNAGDKKSGASGKKKIGKLNVPGPKDTKANEPPKKASDLKKVPKNIKPKEEPKQEKPELKKLQEAKKEPAKDQPVANDVDAAKKPQKEVVTETPKNEVAEQPKKVTEVKKEERTEVKEQPKVDEKVRKEAPAADTKPKVKEEKKEVKEEPKEPPQRAEPKKEQVEKVPGKPKEEPKPAEEKPKAKEIPAKMEEPKKEQVQTKQVEEKKKDEVKVEPTPKAEPEKPKVQPKEVPKPKQAEEKKKDEVKVEAKPKPEPEKPKVQPKEVPKPKVEEKQKTKPQVQPQVDTKASPKVEEGVQKEVKAEEKVEAKPVERKEIEKKPEDIKSEQDVPDALPQKPKVRPIEARMPLYKAVPEEFYDTLFYFSGMGTVVGSALNHGVFVPQRATKTALENKVIEDVEAEKDKERQHETYLIRTARKQAFDIAEELRKLQGLLGGMPSFGQDKSELHKIDRKPVDNVMHAKYHTYEIPHEQRKPRTPPPKAEKPWPPPVQEAPQKPKPATTETQWPPPAMVPQPVNECVPMVETNVGVFKGMKPEKVSPALGNKPWQEKYGTQGMETKKTPEPFNPSGKIPTGLKPWELSRLRGLEVKGYHFTHDQPDSGADHSDTFYHGHPHVEPEETKTKDVPSLAPFLVSNKSQRIDRQHVMETVKDPGDIQSSGHMTMKEYYGLESSAVPYHDF